MIRIVLTRCALSAALLLSIDANATEAAQSPIDATTCTKQTSLALRGAEITSATFVAKGQLGELSGIPPTQRESLPSFCRVAATLRPTKNSDIKIEVWLPAEQWNGRLQGIGNGGLAGSIIYSGLATALKDGYAAASTDTGHSGTPVSGEWALDQPEKVIDFAHRSTHEMTVAAKAIIKSYYGQPAHHAYWNGCSEGGNQALHEAQRYPNDYDGIVAGAPANFMTHLQAGGMWVSHAIHKDPASFISATKLPAINKAVLEACDEIDGLQDGIVDDPRSCSFDISNLRCRSAEGDSCLTPAQLMGLAKVYAGAKDPHSSEQIFPGYMLGSELEWSSWIVGTDTPPKNRQHLIADNLFKYMVFADADWDWRRFKFERDVATADRVAGVTNSINPDLNAFKKRGGKLLQYHGWYDPAISPLNSINYFTSVQKRMGDTKDFYRLFMLPGVAHCGGGPGAGEFDRMSAIVDWVEHRAAPNQLVASRAKDNATRLICAFPKVARYKGTGATNDAGNFACVNLNAK